MAHANDQGYAATKAPLTFAFGDLRSSVLVCGRLRSSANVCDRLRLRFRLRSSAAVCGFVSGGLRRSSAVCICVCGGLRRCMRSFAIVCVYGCDRLRPSAAICGRLRIVCVCGLKRHGGLATKATQRARAPLRPRAPHEGVCPNIGLRPRHTHAHVVLSTAATRCAVSALGGRDDRATQRARAPPRPRARYPQLLEDARTVDERVVCSSMAETSPLCGAGLRACAVSKQASWGMGSP